MHKFLLLFFILPITAFAACPDGYTPQLGPMRDGVAQNSAGQCLSLCAGNFTKINTESGVKYPLFASKNTSPSLGVQVGDNVCYVDLLSGAGRGINITHNDKTYHTYEYLGCPAIYKLSFSCGADATGVAPTTRDVAWGNLFVPGADYGTCERAGYIANGWIMDGNALGATDFYAYTYSGDKTIEVNWTGIPGASYGIAYTCGTCDMPYVTGISSSYGTMWDGQTVSVLSEVPTGCQNFMNAQLKGFRILYSDGTDTGDTVNAGASFVNNYQDNMRLVPIYDGFVARTQYTLTYSCGADATGAPPANRSIEYGGLFVPGVDYGTCQKDGFYPSGWIIDGAWYPATGLAAYMFSGDKTIEVNWGESSETETEYGAAYVCNNGDVNRDYLRMKVGQSYTPYSWVCAAPDGKQFAGYEIEYSDGTPTGDSVAPDASFTFDYNDNIRLSAIWQDAQQ